MIRATSREAFAQLVQSGELQGKQRQALQAVVTYGPCTSHEAIKHAALGENVNLWRARFTELQARGLIVEADRRKCTITGRTAIVWEYTQRVKPLSLKKGHRTDVNAIKALVAAMLPRLDGSSQSQALRAKAKELGL